MSWYTSGSAWVTQQDKVDRVIIQFDSLPVWASDSALSDFDFELGPDTLKLPERKNYTAVIGDATVNLHVGHNVRPSAGGYNASRSATLEIVDSIRLDEVVDKWVKPLRIFLDLVTGSSVKIIGVSVRVADVQQSLDLYSNLLHQTREKPEKTRRQPYIFATRATLDQSGVDFSDLVNRYFDLYNSKHRAGLQALSESQSSLVDQSTASELLSTCQAIEQYHKAAIGGSHIPRNEYADLRNAAVQAIPAQWQDWFYDRVSNCNFKSFSKRIEEVVGRAGDTGGSIETAWPDFRKKVVDSRNKVAHGTSSRDGERVLLYHSAAVGLRWLLRHVYLLKLGVPNSCTDQIIQEDRQFKHDIRLLQTTASSE